MENGDCHSSWLTDSQLSALLDKYKSVYSDGMPEYCRRLESLIDKIREDVLSEVPSKGDLVPILQSIYNDIIDVPMFYNNIAENPEKLHGGVELLADPDVTLRNKVQAVLDKDGEFRVSGLGPAFWSLFFMALDPQENPYWNNKTEAALRFLGLFGSPPYDRWTRYQTIREAQSHLAELSEGLGLLEINHFMHFAYADGEEGRQMVERWRIQAKLDEFIGLVRMKYPAFTSVDDEDFKQDEIQYKVHAAEKANDLIGEEALSTLIEQGDYDEVIDRLIKVGHSTNLLYLSTPSTSDLAILHQENLDKERTAHLFYELLWGKGDSVSRLGRFFKSVEEQGLPNKWVTPTYYLFLLNPDSDFIVKPTAVEWMLEFFEAPFSYESKPDADLYAKILAFVGHLRDELSDYGVSNLLHVQSLVWAAFKMSSSEANQDVEMNSVWWLNAGWAPGSSLGLEYLWVPESEAKGRKYKHLGDISDIKVGDRIITYFDKAIRYVAVVGEEAGKEPRPNTLEPSAPDSDGLYVPLRGMRLAEPIPKESIVDLMGEDARTEILQSDDAVRSFLIKKLDGAFWNDLMESWPELGSDIPEFAGGYRKPEYSLAAIARDTGYEQGYLANAVRAIRRKGQGILYGPPGTGKTFLAQKLASHLIGGGVGFTELVQFHPSYTYEDFIEGLRPERTDSGGLDYRMVPGRFKDFCDRARRVEDPCVLIIDEINRANLSRVFGELMYLLEYRDERVPLAGGSEFEIPPNVYLIGTMNTADRSIALVDHALRRRFAFVHLHPDYNVLRYYHSSRDTGFDTGPLVGILREINREIDDVNYEVGISFFLHEELADHLPAIWRMEIEPYLEEYFFDRREIVERYRWQKVREKLGL